MQRKTRGLVINNMRYRETSLLITIYTAEFGIASYIENGVRSAKAKHKMALFQPMTLLDLEVYHKPGKGLHRISEAKCYYPYQQIPFDIIKSSIALFLSEVLGKVLKEEEENIPLFDFLEESFQYLDKSKAHVENFHIQFLWELSAYLGFGSSNSGEFFSQMSPWIGSEKVASLSPILEELIGSGYGKTASMTKLQRKELVAIMLQYYQIHMESIGEIRSWQVLQEVMAS
ncbi:DNA repair protein RecO [Cytophagaceae bacterium 50C-KIRBA]|uniref:DNA repair protein RecO n=1 Tax=Aquirufa beregesia TaxID=2516556 RepID=A0ABX0EXT9_9BACT|nr:DNA repair protein RecO [Aquirufa beregesia]NGZ44317.1 DNA repair protein RecO [Aquirufa beregesia]